MHTSDRQMDSISTAKITLACYHMVIQETHHEIRIPERDVYLLTYLGYRHISTEPEVHKSH